MGSTNVLNGSRASFTGRCLLSDCGANRLFRAGDELIRQGSPPAHTFQLQSGLIKLLAGRYDSEPTIVGIVTPGRWVGLHTAILGEVSPVSGVALTDCRVRQWHATALSQLIRRDTTVSIKIQETLAKEVQADLLRVANLGLAPERRLQDLIWQLVPVSNTWSFGGEIKVQLPINDEELCALLMVPLSQLTLLFDRLACARVIRREAECIVLLQPSPPSASALEDVEQNLLLFDETPGEEGASNAGKTVVGHFFPTAQIVSWIEDHFQDSEMSVAGISRRFNLSPSYVGRMFKRETGTSVRKFLKLVRIRTASRLLVTTAMATKEISTLVGYKDPSDLIHHFRSVIGTTPSHYRRLVSALRTTNSNETANNRSELRLAQRQIV
jgi:AraC-like DNA-binding protein/CRP-like cAMP-binding protein